MKNIIFILLVIEANLILAQTKTTDNKITNTDTIINSGWVIAYGQLLTKPYRLSMINDTIYINDIRVEPPIINPTLIPEKMPLALQRSDTGEIVLPRTNTFEVNCRNLWAEYMKKNNNDFDTTRQMLAAYIDTQRLVRIRNYEIGKDVRVTFDYRMKDLFLNLSKGKYQADTIFLEYYFYLSKENEDDHPDEEEVRLKARAHAHSSFKSIKGTLRKNELFFRNQVLWMTRSPEQADGIVAAIRKVINAQMSDSLKVKEISRILRTLDTIALEILKNSSSWEIKQ